MPRTARLRKAQNETVKSKINTGFNEALKDTYEDGYYLINGSKLTCEKLKKNPIPTLLINGKLDQAV